jgi:prepilin-type processing-associated H-X9-DG protein
MLRLKHDNRHYAVKRQYHRVLCCASMKRLGHELMVGSAALLVGLIGWRWFQISKVRQQKISCQSRLKYLGFSLNLYAQDFDGKLPDAPTKITQINGDWLQKLWPYNYGQSDYVCPSDEKPFVIPVSYGKSKKTSYVWNDAYSATKDGLSSPSGQVLRQIKKPGQTILLADGTGDSRFKWELKDGASLPIEGDGFKLGSIVGRHNGRPDVLFCDGHVASKPIAQMFLPRTKSGKSYFAGLSIEAD